MRIEAEAKLSLAQLGNLAAGTRQLRQLAPEATFEFVVAIGAEGEAMKPEQVAELNATLKKLNPRLQLS